MKTDREEISTWKARVEGATVRMPNRGGQGVLVPGGFILTATHCIEWSGTGGMALGDVYAETVATPDGAQFRVGVAALDPVSDIAALEELDNQEFGDDCDAFSAWRERVAPVRLSNLALGWKEPCPVKILSHEGKWLTGTVTRYGLPWRPPGHRIALKCNEQIKGGTSGGPIVTEDGRLLGVVSSSGDMAITPIVHLALPKWILDRMEWPDLDDMAESERIRILEEVRAKAAKFCLTCAPLRGE